MLPVACWLLLVVANLAADAATVAIIVAVDIVAIVVANVIIVAVVLDIDIVVAVA